jgi:hypothetical protein
MQRRWTSFLAVTLALGALPAPALALRRAAHVRPRAFTSCARLVAYEQTHFVVTHGVPETSPRPLSEPSIAVPSPSGSASPQTAAAPVEKASTTFSGTSFSTTNNQEPGIEEPDVVKTDGSTIFVVERGTLYAVVVAGPASRLAGSLPLGSTGYGARLLLRGSRLLVISGSQAPPISVGVATPVLPAAVGRQSSALFDIAAALAPSTSPVASVPSIAPSPYYYSATTAITEVDVHDPAAMKVARTMTVEGTFVDARQNGATARLVISSAPRAIATPTLRAHASGWVPARRFHSFVTGHRYTRPVAECSAVRRPAQFSGMGMLSILTINLDRGLYATDSTALMADAQVVYGSSSSLYVATQRWINPLTPATNVPSSPETVIDQFDATNPEHTTLIASGGVPGYLLNQFSLSEYHGYLRVASTSRPIWWNATQPPPSQSYVTVLADHGGVLAAVGQVSGLGAGQQIYSVRFIGDAGYVVTFRRVDPLYTIDLSSPTSPRAAGQLELEGYSAYLHPVAEGLLLGIGQEVGRKTSRPARSSSFSMSQTPPLRGCGHARRSAAVPHRWCSTTITRSCSGPPPRSPCCPSQFTQLLPSLCRPRRRCPRPAPAVAQRRRWNPPAGLSERSVFASIAASQRLDGSPTTRSMAQVRRLIVRL